MKSVDLVERLQESEKLMKDMSKTWEQKLVDTERIHQVSSQYTNSSNSPHSTEWPSHDLY